MPICHADLLRLLDCMTLEKRFRVFKASGLMAKLPMRRQAYLSNQVLCQLLAMIWQARLYCVDYCHPDFPAGLGSSR